MKLKVIDKDGVSQVVDAVTVVGIDNEGNEVVGWNQDPAFNVNVANLDPPEDASMMLLAILSSGQPRLELQNNETKAFDTDPIIMVENFPANTKHVMAKFRPTHPQPNQSAAASAWCAIDEASPAAFETKFDGVEIVRADSSAVTAADSGIRTLTGFDDRAHFYNESGIDSFGLVFVDRNGSGGSEYVFVELYWWE